MEFFAAAKEQIDKSVSYTRQGTRGHFTGRFPKEFRGLVSPSRDTMGYFRKAAGVLEMDDFCLPDFFVWYPESEFQQLYPDGVPPCKFHGCSGCVRRFAWMKSPRRGLTIDSHVCQFAVMLPKLPMSCLH
jgi:hypothetical protein